MYLYLSIFSLVATIQKERPELLEGMKAGQPIPEQMPSDFLEKNSEFIEGIGQPTTACFFTLSDVNPTGW